MFLLNMCLVSFSLINFPWSSTLSIKCPVLFPINPIVKLAQIRILLENVAHTQGKLVFSIETLCNYTQDIVVQLGLS